MEKETRFAWPGDEMLPGYVVGVDNGICRMEEVNRRESRLKTWRSTHREAMKCCRNRLTAIPRLFKFAESALEAMRRYGIDREFFETEIKKDNLCRLCGREVFTAYLWRWVRVRGDHGGRRWLCLTFSALVKVEMSDVGIYEFAYEGHAWLGELYFMRRVKKPLAPAAVLPVDQPVHERTSWQRLKLLLGIRGDKRSKTAA